MGDFKLDFSGIGVAKAGTTWVAQCLGEHPSVCMARGKETNYFMKRHIGSALPLRTRYYVAHHDEGPDWYRAHFAHHRPGQLRGEYSNGYIGDPEAARLLREHNPAMKLLCCFRNPVDTAYAGYHQFSRVQPLPDTFEAFLASYPQILEYGRYHHSLQPFLQRFPREQIRLMLFDDIRTDPEAFYRGICEFLEIDFFAPPALSHRVNPRTVLRSRTVRNLRCAIGNLMRRSAATRQIRTALTRLGVDRLALRLFRLNEKPGAVPPVAPQTRRRLVEYWRKDNEALGELLNRDLSHWNECS